MTTTICQFHYEGQIENERIEDTISVLAEYGMQPIGRLSKSVSVEGKKQSTEKDSTEWIQTVEATIKEGDSVSTWLGEGLFERVKIHVDFEESGSNLRLVVECVENFGDWLALTELGSEVVSQAGFDWGVANKRETKSPDSFEVGFLTVFGESMFKKFGRNRILTAPASALYQTDRAIGIVSGVHGNSGPIEAIEEHFAGFMNRRTSEPDQPAIEFQEPSVYAGDDLIHILKGSGTWDRERIGWDGVSRLPNAIERLRGLLADDSRAEVRAEAAWAIGNSSYRNTEKSQLQMDSLAKDGLTDTSPKVRIEAADGIRELVSNRREPLESAYADKLRTLAFEDPNPDVRAAAVDALNKYSDYIIPEKRQRWFIEIYESESALEPRVSALGAATLMSSDSELLLDGIESKHPELQNKAASVLGTKAQIGYDTELFDELSNRKDRIYRALGHPNEDIRKAVVHTLAHLDSDDIPVLLAASLSDVNEKVRGAAARTLGKFPHPDAVEQLITALDEDTELVQKKAARGIKELAQEYPDAVATAVPALVEKLDSTSTDVAEAAAQALAEIETVDAVDTLLDLLEVDEVETTQIALALGELGATERLIGRFETSEGRRRSIIAKGLAKTEDSRAFRPLVRAWRQDGSAGVIEPLGELGDPRGVHPLLSSLWARNRNAPRALGKLGEPAVTPLLEILENETGEPQYLAAEALGRTGDTRAFRPLLEALTAPDPNLRKAIIKGFRSSAFTRLCPVFRQLSLLDPNEDVREAAEETLRTYALI